MPIEYKMDILKALKEKDYTTTRLRNEKLIGEATIQRLRHNKSVSFEVLAKLCDLLECDISDILMKTIICGDNATQPTPTPEQPDTTKDGE